jgi:hypothetical protein
VKFWLKNQRRESERMEKKMVKESFGNELTAYAR